MYPKEFLPNPEGLLAFICHKAAQSMEDHLNSILENMDLNTRKWSILYRCFKHNSLEEAQIHKIFVISKEEAKSLVENLKEKDLVEVIKNANNPKENLVILTDKGLRFIPEVMPIIMQNIGIFREGINPEDIITTVNVLNKVFHNLNPQEQLYQLETPPQYIEVEN